MSSGAGDAIEPRDGAISTAIPSRLDHSAALIARNAPGEMGLKRAERSRFALRSGDQWYACLDRFGASTRRDNTELSGYRWRHPRGA
jgi:hypothetical protein